MYSTKHFTQDQMYLFCSEGGKGLLGLEKCISAENRFL